MVSDYMPELSIIVPVLNEADNLLALLDNLKVQQGIRFEILICDGGSSDGTEHLLEEREASDIPVIYLRAERGRGCQMNVGADVARSDILLFLHVDSRFDESTALASAAAAFREHATQSAAPLAARFRLHFRRTDPSPSLAYSFYESKARLNRADCIRGDQGFMLGRALFLQLGRFDESLPFLEDVRLSFAVEEHAAWALLPVTISTSARRFETEGLCERQVINAIIANAVHLSWEELFPTLPGLYRCSSESGRLLLFPLLEGIRSLIASHDPGWRRSFWLGTGRYVAGNIWQLFFWLDVRAAFRRGKPICSPGRWSRRYSRYIEKLAASSPMAAITSLAVLIWFRTLLVTSRRKIH